MLPNILSGLRILMVPAFVAVYFSEAPNARVWAGIIFVVAAITDMLDGQIARKYNLVTKLGRFLDPLADKLMTATALLCIIIAGQLPVWILVLYCVKELCMGIGAIIIYKRTTDVIASTVPGKVAALLFYSSCAAIILFNLSRATGTWVMAGALVVTFAALVSYGVKLYTSIKKG